MGRPRARLDAVRRPRWRRCRPTPASWSPRSSASGSPPSSPTASPSGPRRPRGDPAVGHPVRVRLGPRRRPLPLAVRRPVARRALLAFALHRTMAQDGGGWLAGIRRGTVGSVTRTAAHHRPRRRGAGAGGGPRPARRRREGAPRHHAGRLRHPPDGQPAGRHPGPHRRPQRPRGVHGAGRRQELLAPHRARRVRRPPLDVRAGLRRRRRRARRRPPPAAHLPLNQEFTIQALDAIWLPAAYAPERIDIPTASATTTRPPAS